MTDHEIPDRDLAAMAYFDTELGRFYGGDAVDHQQLLVCAAAVNHCDEVMDPLAAQWCNSILARPDGCIGMTYSEASRMVWQALQSGPIGRA